MEPLFEASIRIEVRDYDEVVRGLQFCNLGQVL
jgi:hypothetical protein